MVKLNPDDFIGKVYKTNTSGDCFIIDFKNTQNITVMFYDGYCTKVHKGNLDKGKVKNPFHINNLAQGVGLYDGSRLSNLKESLKVQNLWRNMLQRCYDSKFHERQPTYTDVTVCERWLTYSNFEKDIAEMENYKMFIENGWELDKDLLLIGNKEYSKDCCSFLPRALNSKFSKISSIFEGDTGTTVLPYGGYRVNVSGIRGKKSHIGCYKTKEEALHVYRKYKCEILLQSLQEYVSVIDQNVVTSVTNYIESYRNQQST